MTCACEQRVHCKRMRMRLNDDARAPFAFDHFVEAPAAGFGVELFKRNSIHCDLRKAR